MKILEVSEKLFLQIRRGPNFANPEGPNFANPEKSQFCQSGRVPINFANPEGSQFCQSGGVLFLPILRGPVFAGSVLFLPIRRGPLFAKPEGSRERKYTLPS